MRVKRVRILDVKDENDSIIDIDMWAKFLNLKKIKNSHILPSSASVVNRSSHYRVSLLCELHS